MISIAARRFPRVSQCVSNILKFRCLPLNSSGTYANSSLKRYFSNPSSQLQKSDSSKEAISPENSAILYSNPAFASGINQMLESKFHFAEQNFEKALDELSLAGHDTPEILAAILRRQAVCLLNLKKYEKMESTLRECLIVRLAEPQRNTYEIFTSFYNLLVFYNQVDCEAGADLFSNKETLLEGIVFPSSLKLETDLMASSLLIKAGRFAQALTLLENLEKEACLMGGPRANRLRGFAANNKAVAMFLQFGEKQTQPKSPLEVKELLEKVEKEIEGISEVFKLSIAIFEGLADHGGEMGQTDNEDQEKEKEALSKDQAENMMLFLDLVPKNKRKADKLFALKLEDLGMKNADSLIPLMNLGEISQKVVDNEKQTLFYSNLALGLAKKVDILTGAFRAMTYMLSASLKTDQPLDQYFQDILRYIDGYHISPYLKNNALQTYMVHLQKEKRYFEMNEVFQILSRIKYQETDYIQDMVYTSDYYF